MNLFDDPEERMKYLYDELKKIDDLHDAFRKEFDDEVSAIIRSVKPDFSRSKHFNEILNQHATTVLSSAFTVIDKDTNYPDYRKMEELQSLQNLYARIDKSDKDQYFVDNVLKKTKELLVKYCPQIFDLSGEGFRLLDVTLLLFNLDFIANLNAIDKISQFKE